VTIILCLPAVNKSASLINATAIVTVTPCQHGTVSLCFNSNYICILCYATRDDIQTNFREEEFALRTLAE
jgi:hypothetical protein